MATRKPIRRVNQSRNTGVMQNLLNPYLANTMDADNVNKANRNLSKS